jgi:protein gp37
LSGAIDFPYLEEEIIRNAGSEAGRRHLWLWLSTRPSRMAQFGAWLEERGLAWPDNLVAMTTVTSEKTLRRVDALKQVPSKLKALSLEPLFGPVSPALEGIDWVIAGGGSDVLAEPFQVEWALDLRSRCAAAGVAFFLKQLGRRPCFEGKPLQLRDGHGGDWGEWPASWRVREIPARFHAR